MYINRNVGFFKTKKTRVDVNAKETIRLKDRNVKNYER